MDTTAKLNGGVSLFNNDYESNTKSRALTKGASFQVQGRVLDPRGEPAENPAINQTEVLAEVSIHILHNISANLPTIDFLLLNTRWFPETYYMAHPLCRSSSLSFDGSSSHLPCNTIWQYHEFIYFQSWDPGQETSPAYIFGEFPKMWAYGYYLYVILYPPVGAH